MLFANVCRGGALRMPAAASVRRTMPVRASAVLGQLKHYSTEFDLNRDTAMYKQKPPAPGEDFRVLIVGAGNIMFGSDEGPWNHSFRLEHKLGPRLKVTALVDPNSERSKQTLHFKNNSFVTPAYKDTEVYPDLQSYLANLSDDKRPPAFRGRLEKGRDLEIQLSNALPGTAMFIEKPISTGPVEEVLRVGEQLRERAGLVGVGYMLRYLKVVQKMKQILEEKQLKVKAINARYIMAYEHLAKYWWWNKQDSLGPVIEQATHFCDLSRYFGGDVDLSTVLAHSLEYFEPAGSLNKLAIDENRIAPEDRVPRATGAVYKFKNGAVGSLMHVVALHGTDFATELDVYADGYSLRLFDPYNNPTLYVRSPGDDHEEIIRYASDDPFYTEVSNMIDCIEHGDKAAPVLSTYEDAAQTYALTWAIRLASERSAQAYKAAA